MSILDFLKHKWVILGLDAPVVSWVAAFGLVLWTGWHLVRLTSSLKRVVRRLRAVSGSLKTLRTEHIQVGYNSGLPEAAYEELNHVFPEGLPLRSSWEEFNSHIIRRPNDRNEDTFWASESAESAFGAEDILIHTVNRSSYAAWPGIVTGLGLLFTFLAILIALLDVRLVNNRVQGIELLIEGLSGKFVSSIAALLAATVFVLTERRLFHWFERRRRECVAAMDAMVPRLTPARILVDVQRDVREQSLAARDFNSGLAPILQRSISESMGPILERMIKSIETLNELLRKSEADKQESISGSIESLLERLERSLSDSIDRMGRAFSTQLSGSARDEMGEVVRSIAETTQLLNGMNNNFSATQTTLQGLIQFAEATTREQLQTGRVQIEALTGALQQLLDRMEQTTGQSVETISNAVSTVVAGLSAKVDEMAGLMRQRMEESAIETAGVAEGVMQQATTLSSQNAQTLNRLLETHDSQLARVKELRETLESTLNGFHKSLEMYRGVTSDLSVVARQAVSTVTAVERAASTMAVTQSAIQALSQSVTSQVSQLTQANTRHEEFWESIEASLQRYQSAFVAVEKAAGGMLNQIGEHVDKLLQTTRDGYQQLTTSADTHFTNATARLGSSVEQLNEVLDELSEILEKVRAA